MGPWGHGTTGLGTEGDMGTWGLGGMATCGLGDKGLEDKDMY